MAKHDLIKNISVGDVITADLLNKIATTVNANTRALRSPRSIAIPDDELTNDPSTGVGNEVFDSTSGTETTVVHTDSAGDTVSIDRVDTIVLTEQTSGRTMTLNITYPL